MITLWKTIVIALSLWLLWDFVGWLRESWRELE